MKRLKSLWFALFLLCSWALSGQSLHVLSKDLPCVNQNFNVYVHVVLDSLRNTNYTPEHIIAGLELTNRLFSPICMTFTLCKYDTIYNYNFDSLALQKEFDEVTTLFEAGNRLNIYVVDKIVLAPPETVCGIGGRYILLSKTCGPGTVVHEMGHVFGLPHTFEGNGTENVDGSNCETEGDRICDTPADPYDPDIAKDFPYQRGCEFTYTGLDANGTFYQPDMGNVMSYYGCDCGFTRGQYLKMVQTYTNGKRQLW